MEVKLEELDMKSNIIFKALSDRPLTLDILQKVYKVGAKDLIKANIDTVTFWRTKNWTMPRKDNFDNICNLFRLNKEELIYLINEWKDEKRWDK